MIPPVLQRTQGMTRAAAIRDLGHAKPQVRLRAARAIVNDLRNDELCEATRDALHRALRDTSDPVRQAAALALGRLEDPSAVPMLVELLDGDDHSRVRQAAVVALGQIGASSASPALRSALDDRAAEVRAELPAALLAVDAEAAGSTLVLLLEDGSSEVRANAAAALGDLGYLPARNQLVALLADEQGCARIEAAVALCRMGDARGINEVAGWLQDRKLRLLAAEQLFGRATSEISNVLRRALHRPLGDRVARVWIAATLAAFADADGQLRLRSGLRSRNPVVKGLTIQLLGRIQSAWSLGVLEEFRRSPAAKGWQDEIAAALVVDSAP